MKDMNQKVDSFFSKASQWQDEFMELRKIILDCQLTEEMKWGAPCYTYQNKNIAILGGFKEYCVVSFFKGILLHDPQGILDKPGENTQAARLIRFTHVDEIVEMAPILKDFINEAIEVEKSGLKVDLNAKAELKFPEEFQSKINEMPALRTAFEALTPGRQRAYILYFSAPKQAKTRASRVEKYLPRILNGKGLNDR